MLHLALEPGTDLVLFNALLTYIADKGWIDKAFIAASTLPAEQGAALISRPGGAPNDQPLTDFDAALAANRTSIDDAAKITGLKAEDIVKAAQWIAEPKSGGKRRRTMLGYEKGIIWGNDNYRTNGAIVNLALATGNVGRPGGGVVQARRPSGGLFTSFRRSRRASCCLCRQAPDRRPRRHSPHLGMRSLQNDAERPQA